MITYEEAYKTAKELKPSIDFCTEYENGYVFSCTDDENYIGGGHSPCVILKKNGKAVTMPWFIAKIGTGNEIRSFDLE